MRPVEKKVLQKINDKGITLYEIEEIIDNISRQEMKKSYPDDSHFQTPKYFAKQIANSLIRYGYAKKEGSRLFKNTKNS